MTTIIDSLQAALNAANNNASAYFALQQAVALRETGAVQVAGLTPNPSDPTEMAQALSLGVLVGTLAGSANALTGALLGVQFPQLRPYMEFTCVSPWANTGSVTLALGGFTTAPTPPTGSGLAAGTLPLLGRGGGVLQAGDISPNTPFRVRADGQGNYRMTQLTISELTALISTILGGTLGGTVSSGVTAGLLTGRVPTNLRRLTNNTRATLSGQGVNAFVPAVSPLLDQSGNKFTKVGGASTTNLLCLASIAAYNPQSGSASSTVARFTDGTNIDTQYIGQTINLSGVGAVSIPGIAFFLLTNVPPGALNLQILFGRQDTTAWSCIANPDGVDFGGTGSHTGTGATSAFVCMEIPAT